MGKKNDAIVEVLVLLGKEIRYRREEAKRWRKAYDKLTDEYERKEMKQRLVDLLSEMAHEEGHTDEAA